MNNQTIHQVDPIALRQKLQKLGIGAGYKLSATFAEDAVSEFMRVHGPKDFTSSKDPATVLEPAELAYCLDAWAKLWEVPA